MKSAPRNAISPDLWSAPFNFGTVSGLPPGWTVRWFEGDEHWYYLIDDDEEQSDGIYSSPHQARRYAIARAKSMKESAP